MNFGMESLRDVDSCAIQSPGNSFTRDQIYYVLKQFMYLPIYYRVIISVVDQKVKIIITIIIIKLFATTTLAKLRGCSCFFAFKKFNYFIKKSVFNNSTIFRNYLWWCVIIIIFFFGVYRFNSKSVENLLIYNIQNKAALNTTYVITNLMVPHFRHTFKEIYCRMWYTTGCVIDHMVFDLTSSYRRNLIIPICADALTTITNNQKSSSTSFTLVMFNCSLSNGSLGRWLSLSPTQTQRKSKSFWNFGFY